MRAGEVTLLLRKLARRHGTERHSILSGLFNTTYAEMNRIEGRLLASHRACAVSQTELDQEASLRLLNSQGELKNSRHFYGSAENAMRNALVDNWRRSSSHKRGGEYLIEALGCDEPEGPARSQTLRLDLQRAVDELSDDAKRLFELVFVEGRTCREAAALLGISYHAAEHRLLAIRVTLRRKLTRQGTR